MLGLSVLDNNEIDGATDFDVTTSDDHCEEYKLNE